MEDPERDEPEAAEEAEDLDLQPDEVEAVKGGVTTSGGMPKPPPLGPDVGRPVSRGTDERRPRSDALGRDRAVLRPVAGIADYQGLRLLRGHSGR